jgi:hypothetical protein
MRNSYAFKVFVAGTDLKALVRSKSSNNEQAFLLVSAIAEQRRTE